MDRNGSLCCLIIKISLSLSARRAWIEMDAPPQKHQTNTGSLSARRAWIEILKSLAILILVHVALRKESVDRNQQCRNGQNIKRRVALRKESVDRNCYCRRQGGSSTSSLSARRAWIEISIDDLEPSRTRSRSPQGERG